MKKIFVLVMLFSAFSVSAQTITSIQELTVKGWDRDAYLALHDEYYGKVTFKEGSGVVIERIRMSDGSQNMRLRNYGVMNDWGVASERGAFEERAFWRGLAEQVSENGPFYASKGVFAQGGNLKYKITQVFEFKAKDPQAYLNALKIWLDENKDIILDRRVSLQAYTVAGPNGASHSLSIEAENWVELEKLREVLMSNTKSIQKFYQTRGETTETRNFTAERLRHYSNLRIKSGTTKD